ncbi:Rec8 like protein-domain-containing protein [Lipomyces arxii]|uniref:Rec8 like protein-domain-containing protein n=1 Tax=Lipomyces arxii TaxID=56418 RepID=UPI0034CFC76D
MFYSDVLLSKKGPLARVWLAANLERKLSKAQFLQTDIEKSVGAIVGDDVAPMALRLSGQLLLGVVRIYSRKAKYLLDDCNEALMKLRMTFSKGNVDLATSAVAVNPQQLVLPNTITELDLLLPDPSAILGFTMPAPASPVRTAANAHTSSVKDITLPELQDSIELGRGEMIDELANMGDDDLVLDTGEYLDASEEQPTHSEERYEAPMFDYEPEVSLEMGRDAQEPVEDFREREEEDFGLEIFDERPLDKPLELGDMDMEEMPTLDQINDEPLTPLRDADLNRSNRLTAEAEDGLPLPKKTSAPTKRKLKVDDVTELKSAFIRDMQENRTGILKDYPTLPRSRDDVTLASMYEKGDVFDFIYKPAYMNDSLQSLLIPQLLPEINQNKRKEISDAAEEKAEGNSKRLHTEEVDERYEAPNIEDEEDRYALPDGFADQRDLDIDFDADVQFSSKDNDTSAIVARSDLVEDDIVNAVPATQAVNNISRHTKETAVVLQTELLKTDTVDFQSLTAESSRQDAVKFFFETLVLATKDAVEVEQKNPYGIINIKAKEALFETDWLNTGVEQTQAEVAAN